MESTDQGSWALIRTEVAIAGLEWVCARSFDMCFIYCHGDYKETPNNGSGCISDIFAFSSEPFLPTSCYLDVRICFWS